MITDTTYFKWKEEAAAAEILHSASWSPDPGVMAIG
jgi:hypothetical protein